MKPKRKMTEDSDTDSSFSVTLPTELLNMIFSYLPAKTLIRCREVCLRWKEIVEDLLTKENVWLKFCEKEFKSLYKVAKRKAQPGVTSYELYKSLSLWPMLETANEEVDEFALASSVHEEILCFEILRDGLVGVQTKDGIVYYNLETLRLDNRDKIIGQYLEYVENDEAVIILDSFLHLFILRNNVQGPHQKSREFIDNVKLFLVLEDKVFIVNLYEEIFVCDLTSDNLNVTFLQRAQENIMCLGHREGDFYILTYDRNVYKVDINSYIFTCMVDSFANLLSFLQKFNFLEHMEWRTYYHWLFVLNQTPPSGPLRFIDIIRRYGDIYFIAIDWGLLRIYYIPDFDDDFDIYNTEPVKQFNFSQRFDCPVLTMSSILHIDVSEIKDGHKVLVGMQRKIVIINFTHNFRAVTSLGVHNSSNSDSSLK